MAYHYIQTHVARSQSSDLKMVFTIVNSTEFTFRKYKKHENGHLAHYDSFRGGESHLFLFFLLPPPSNLFTPPPVFLCLRFPVFLFLFLPAQCLVGLSTTGALDFVWHVHADSGLSAAPQGGMLLPPAPCASAGGGGGSGRGGGGGGVRGRKGMGGERGRNLWKVGGGCGVGG